MDIIKFPSVVELVSYDSDGVLPTSETTAIELKDDDDSDVITAPSNTQATLFIDFTKGSLTNVIIKFYGSYLGSPTSDDYFSETIESSTTGTITLSNMNITLTATGKHMYHLPIGALRSYKITVTGTGTATSSALKLYLGLRNN
jgi:hypothetical protein